MDAHRLRMAAQFGGDLVGCLACPAQQHHLGVKFPISGRVMALGQLVHHAFFLLILRCSRFHLLGHLCAPPFVFFSSLILSPMRNAAVYSHLFLVLERISEVASTGDRIKGMAFPVPFTFQRTRRMPVLATKDIRSKNRKDLCQNYRPPLLPCHHKEMRVRKN
jgi:hypothetical protein